MRKFILAALFAAGIITTPQITEASTMATYRVVHTGDSISALAWGIPSTPVAGAAWVSGTEEWRNLEYGRDAYTVGLEGWASTNSIWPLIRDRSEPGGFIVVQDNGLSTTDTQWRTLMERIRNETPSDRTLIVVLPGYRWDKNSTHYQTLVTRAKIMKEVLGQHPSVVFIHLDQYMRRNPNNFPDGQHPNTAGAAWLRAQIDAWTGS